MDIYSIDELMLMTRNEICDIAEHLERKLVRLEADNPVRTYVLISLYNIRRVMLWRDLHF